MFKQYKTTLIHPLFVGWFCFLILENKFEEIETKSDNVHIRQNNLVSRIVEIGIQESLQRRESSHKDSGITSQGSEFVNLLKTFVAVAFHNTIHHPDEIFTRMVKLGYCDDLSDSLKHSIMHDCGILYLTGESIEWTHSTVPELIYADFFHDAQRSFRLGSLRVTEPILLRLAQLDYEQGRAASFEIALMRLYHRHDRQNFEEMCWDIWIEQGDDRNSFAPLIRMAETGRQPSSKNAVLRQGNSQECILTLWIRPIASDCTLTILKKNPEPPSLNTLLAIPKIHLDLIWFSQMITWLIINQFLLRKSIQVRPSQVVFGSIETLEA